VLNAKQHEREAHIVAQAGRLHTVTVATNMAGRGVDIILGGNPEEMAKLDSAAEGFRSDSDEGRGRYEQLLTRYEVECAAEGEKVRGLGGLYVLGTERHESAASTTSSAGRSGRQGDPGESRFYLSLEDELMRLFATGAMSGSWARPCPTTCPSRRRWSPRPSNAPRAPSRRAMPRSARTVLKYDEVMNEQRKVIYRRASRS